MTSQLHFEKYGDSGPAVVILHGLFGSSKNWVSVARQLAADYRVFTVDARNHGRSFHSDEHSVALMADDLQQFLADEQISQPVLLGHSMGGLTAIRYTLHNPNKVAALLVVDIAPRMYQISYQQEFAALKMDIGRFTSRKEIDEALKKIVTNQAVRQFLQTNIESDSAGRYRWVLNVAALEKAHHRADPQLAEGMVYHGPALFMRSLKEDFITDDDLPLIRRYFPSSQVLDFSQGNHWLHITEPGFLPAVKTFLKNLKK